MTSLTRRAVVAAGATVAAGVPLGKPRAQALQGIGSLSVLHEPKKLDLQFTAGDGTTRTLADYSGRVVVLNLWATWCVPCVREMPALDDLAKFGAKDGIVVLPVSSDRGGAAVVQRFYTDQGIKNLPVLLDPGSRMAHGLGVNGIPTTFLIDRNGFAGRVAGGCGGLVRAGCAGGAADAGWAGQAGRKLAHQTRGPLTQSSGRA